jgi:hypothetical protein
MNMEDRVGVRGFVARRTVDILLLITACRFAHGVRVLAVVACGLVFTESDQMLVQGLGGVHLMKVHSPRSRCARPGNKRDESDRKDFAQQTHGGKLLHWHCQSMKSGNEATQR